MNTLLQLAEYFVIQPALVILWLRATPSQITVEAVQTIRQYQIQHELQLQQARTRAVREAAESDARVDALFAQHGLSSPRTSPSAPEPTAAPTVSPLAVYAEVLLTLLAYRGDPPAGPNLTRAAEGILRQQVDAAMARRLASEEGHPLARPVVDNQLAAVLLGAGQQDVWAAAALALPRERLADVLATLGSPRPVEPGAQDPARPRFFPVQRLFTLASPWPWVGQEVEQGGLLVSRIQHTGAHYSGTILDALQRLGGAAADGPACLRAVVLAGGPYDAAGLDRAFETWIAGQSFGLRGSRGKPAVQRAEIAGLPAVVHEYRWRTLLIAYFERRYLVPHPQGGGCVMWWECPAADADRWRPEVDAIARSFGFGGEPPAPGLASHVPVAGAAGPRTLAPGELGLGVPEVDAALAGAWLYDVGQGDLAAARAAADQTLAAQPTAWHAHFARAAVDATAGEPAAALARLEALWPVSDGASRRLVACLGYRTETWGLGLRPDGSVAIDGTPPDGDRWLRRFNQVVGDSELDARELLLARAGVTAPGRLRLSSAEEEQLTTTTKIPTRTVIAGLRDDARALSRGQSRFAAFLLTVAARLAANLDGPDDALAGLAELAGHAAAAGDPVMQAWCNLTWADVLLAARARDAARRTGAPVPFMVARRSDDDAAACARARAAYEAAVLGYRQAGAPRGVIMATCRLAALDAALGDRDAAVRALDTAAGEAAALEDRSLAREAAFLALWIDAQWGAAAGELGRRAAYLAGSAATDGAHGPALAWARIFRESGDARFAAYGDAEGRLGDLRVTAAVYEALGAGLWSIETGIAQAETLVALQAHAEAAAELERALVRVEAALTADAAPPELWAALGRLATRAQQVAQGVGDANLLQRSADRLQAIADRLPARDGRELLAALALDPATAILQGKQATLTAAFAELPRFMAREACLAAARFARFVAVLLPAQSAFEAGERERGAPLLASARALAQELGQRDLHLATCAAVERDRATAVDLLRRYAEAGCPAETPILERIHARLAQVLGQSTADAGGSLAGRWAQIVELLVVVEAWPEAAQALARFDELSHGTGGTSPLDGPALQLARARIADGLGDPIAAAMHYSAAAEALEATRAAQRSQRLRRAVSAQRLFQDVHASWTLFSAAQGRWEDAFVQADRARARSLTEVLAAEPSEPPDVTRLRAEIERLHGELLYAHGHAEGRVAALEAALAEADRRAAELGLPPAPPPVTATLSQVAARLDEGTLLLAYLYHRDALLAWAVTRDGLVRTHRVSQIDGERFAARPFGARLRHLTTQLSELRPTDAQRQAATRELSQLGDVLLAPFADDVAAATRVLVVPYAELTTFAFGALPCGGRVLGLAKSLAFVYAAALVAGPPAPVRPRDSALVVGNPGAMALLRRADGQPDPLPPLPGAEDEAKQVAALYGAMPLLGPAATREAFLRRLIAAPSPAVIHLATHGSFDPDVPLASCVALASGEVLSADAWAGLRIDAELVVLSACSTASGQLQGDELVGLTRALLLAGARAVLVTLWPVHDRLSVALMTALHEALRRGDPVEEALRQAVVRVATSGRELDPVRRGSNDALRDMKRRASAGAGTLDPGWPACWAPFVIVRASE